MKRLGPEGASLREADVLCPVSAEWAPSTGERERAAQSLEVPFWSRLEPGLVSTVSRGGSANAHSLMREIKPSASSPIVLARGCGQLSAVGGGPSVNNAASQKKLSLSFANTQEDVQPVTPTLIRSANYSYIQRIGERWETLNLMDSTERGVLSDFAAI